MSISLAIASFMSSASVAAMAQSATSAEVNQVPQETEAPDDPSTDVVAGDQDSVSGNAIVVTGSRLVTDGTRAPTPVTVVSTEDLAANAPQGISEGLNQLPIFQGSQNASMTMQSLGTRVRSGNYMNLRYLGPPRVLILMDGNRLPPSGNYGAVDSNVIPQMLIERVDVVTGGASAVYGSDAVSGVVNYIIDKRFTGLKTLSQVGISAYNDALSYRLGAAAGTSLADDRLQLQVSAEYYWNEGIPGESRGSEGRWSLGALDPTLAAGPPGSIDNPYLDYSGVSSTTTSLGGLIYGGPAGLVNMHFLPSGELVPFRMGTPIGRPGAAQGSDGPDLCLSCNSLMAETSTTQVFGRATYDFGSNIEGYVQGSYNEATNRGTLGYSTGNVTLFRDNYYVQQQLTPAQLAAFGTAQSVSFRRDLREWGQYVSDQNLKSIIVNGGLSGELFGDWTWDAGFSYGKTDFEAIGQDDIRTDRLLAAIDTVAGPNGNPVCRVTLVSNRFPDCVPLNVLGEGRADPAAIRWTMEDSVWGVVNTLYAGGVSVAGSLFSTWAGPVSLAVGVDYRKQSIVQTSNSDPTVPVDFTGIRGGSGNPFRGTNVGASEKGTYNVKEVYAETVIPLIKDASFTDSLEINAAFRHADYSVSGGVNTYKIGATWQPVYDIIFRGAFSRDIRAPSLTELFGAVSNIERTVFDPVTDMMVTVDNPTGGNLNLKPEKGDTITAGVVLRPSFLPDFYGSIDYFDIKIKDAIGTPGTLLQIFQACTSNAASPLCDLIIRDANNVPIEVSGKNENVAVVSTRGVDFEFGYRAPLGKGDLSIRALATRLISYRTQDTDAVPIIENVGTSDLRGFLSGTYPLPKWRGNVSIDYRNGGFSIGIQERMIGSFIKSDGLSYYVDNNVGTTFYTDINIAQKIPAFGGEAEVFASVNDLFNRIGPRFIPGATGGGIGGVPTARSIYGIVGRYVTVGVRTNF